MQVHVLCTCEVRQGESRLLWVGGVQEREVSPLLAQGLQTLDGMPRMIQLDPFLQQG